MLATVSLCCSVFIHARRLEYYQDWYWWGVESDIFRVGREYAHGTLVDGRRAKQGGECRIFEDPRIHAHTAISRPDVQCDCPNDHGL